MSAAQPSCTVWARQLEFESLCACEKQSHGRATHVTCHHDVRPPLIDEIRTLADDVRLVRHPSMSSKTHPMQIRRCSMVVGVKFVHAPAVHDVITMCCHVRSMSSEHLTITPGCQVPSCGREACTCPSSTRCHHHVLPCRIDEFRTSVNNTRLAKCPSMLASSGENRLQARPHPPTHIEGGHARQNRVLYGCGDRSDFFDR